jgi:pyrimidine operon attenuation protein/uracil phosphoribosyltransferase
MNTPAQASVSPATVSAASDFSGAPDAEAIFASLKAAVAAWLAGITGRRPALVGIHTGGAWLAERLHRELCPDAQLGFLSSAFHRDDFAHRGLRTGTGSGAGKTRIEFEVDGADILLIDDILYTGRTVRAAINELYDYGRPRSVELAVLLDRGGRELPVQAGLCGARIPLQPDQGFVLSQLAEGGFSLTVERV